MFKTLGKALLVLAGASLAAPAGAAAPVQQWEVVRPDGIVITEPINVNAHPDALDGKTVVLRWSAKPNGDIMMERVAELLKKDFPTAKVVLSWENQPAGSLLSAGWSANRAKSARMASAIRDLKPDLVIGGQGD